MRTCVYRYYHAKINFVLKDLLSIREKKCCAAVFRLRKFGIRRLSVASSVTSFRDFFLSATIFTLDFLSGTIITHALRSRSVTYAWPAVLRFN